MSIEVAPPAQSRCHRPQSALRWIQWLQSCTRNRLAGTPRPEASTPQVHPSRDVQGVAASLIRSVGICRGLATWVRQHRPGITNTAPTLKPSNPQTLNPFELIETLNPNPNFKTLNPNPNFKTLNPNPKALKPRAQRPP